MNIYVIHEMSTNISTSFFLGFGLATNGLALVRVPHSPVFVINFFRTHLIRLPVVQRKLENNLLWSPHVDQAITKSDIFVTKNNVVGILELRLDKPD